ncbi:MAG: BTAD domain-containing putative transcriptional regulator [Ilumatobacteraceae bacterium]
MFSFDPRCHGECGSQKLLPEDRYEDWAAPHRDRLSAVRTRLVGDVAPALIAGGLPEQALAMLEPLAVEWSLDEDVHQSLLVALAAVGRPGTRRLPSSASGTDSPSRTASTRARDHRRLPPTFRRWRPGSGDVSAQPPHVVNQLRRSPSGTGGAGPAARTDAPAHVGRLGGAGKTRLAVELAHGEVASSQWTDGVWLVELAGVTHGDDVPSAVGGSLDLPVEGTVQVRHASERRREGRSHHPHHGRTQRPGRGVGGRVRGGAAERARSFAAAAADSVALRQVRRPCRPLPVTVRAARD